MNSLLKAIQGHEIWVLAEGSHGHPGRRVAGRVFYGHAMHPDGLADLARLKAMAVGPDQEKLEVSLEEGKSDFHAAVFTPERQGIWILVVENDIGPPVITRDGQYKRGTRQDYPEAQHAQDHSHGYHNLEGYSNCGFPQCGYREPESHSHGYPHRQGIPMVVNTSMNFLFWATNWKLPLRQSFAGRDRR